jgi:hypothetical protein
MTFKPSALGVIGISVSITLTPEPNAVRVLRLVQLSPEGPVKFGMPLLVGAFKAENERVLKALKSAAENEAISPPAKELGRSPEAASGSDLWAP